ncbi:MAG: hypothetical protein Ta2F_15160 [Termitinemataceae bacterium]|nr:MAG: hypothetical protein Ta2F_15160 [Termitinemataceae bacterium]
MASSNVGRSVFLLLLIIIVVAGGLVWFDYLNVIDIKTFLAPVYNKLGLSGRSQPSISKGEFINLDAERLAVRLEALDLRQMEMDKISLEIEAKKNEIEQMAAELETRQQALEQLEGTMDALANEAESIDRNLETNARYLNSMPPANAVAILERMDDLDVIKILRKVDQIAEKEGGASLSSVWLMTMNPEKVAEIQRKMASAP